MSACGIAQGFLFGLGSSVQVIKLCVKSVISRLRIYFSRGSLIRTPQSRLFPEKLIVANLVKKCYSFYGSRRFIVAFVKSGDTVATLLWYVLTLSCPLCIDLPSGTIP